MDCTPETGHFISPSLLYHWKKQYSRGKFDSEPTEEAVPLVTTSEKCTRRWRSWVGLRNRKGKKPYASAGLLERKVVLKCQY